MNKNKLNTGQTLKGADAQKIYNAAQLAFNSSPPKYKGEVLLYAPKVELKKGAAIKTHLETIKKALK